MSILCQRFRAVVGTLVALRDDDERHPKEAAWASKLIDLISGPDGFNRLAKFAVDCDFAVACNRMIRMQDKSSADIALSVTEVTECLEICYVLFDEGRAFDLEDNHTYTGHLLRSFLRPTDVTASSQASNQRGTKALGQLGIGWPKDISESDALKEGKRYAKTLYKMAFKFLKLNFPDYSWRTKFGAFTCGPTAFPEAYRMKCLEKLAVKEGLDKAQTRFQFQQVFPHMQRLYRETGDNRLAWSKLLESFRNPTNRRKFRADMSCVLHLAVTYIGILDVTTDVERCFSRLQRLEIKSRERHCHPSRLEDSLNIVLEVPSSVDALVDRRHEPMRRESKSQIFQEMWRPGPLLIAAQSKYAEFFGQKKLACRSLVVKPLALRATECPVGRVYQCSEITPKKAALTKKEVLNKWTTHVQDLVKDWRKR